MDIYIEIVGVGDSRWKTTEKHFNPFRFGEAAGEGAESAHVDFER